MMKSNYSGDKKDKYDGFFFCEKTCNGNYKMNKSACGGSFMPEMKSDKEIRQSIVDIAGLYKVKEIQLSCRIEQHDFDTRVNQAKKFLSEQTIELPDLSGNHALDKHNFPVYREIIDTINYRGRLLTANDIIGG